MADRVREPFWNVPNSLTMSRLVMAFAVFALIAQAYYLSALVVFGLAGLTDALDGYFARLLGQSTTIGRQLDPLVDKVIVSGGFIYLLTVPEHRPGPLDGHDDHRARAADPGPSQPPRGPGRGVRRQMRGQVEDPRPMPRDLGHPALSRLVAAPSRVARRPATS